MALPKLETPKYTCVLPLSKKTVEYRPFLVGEQKILLIAQESDDANQQIREMIRMIDVCCDDIKAEFLASADLEYLFLQVRIKSAGETSEVIIPCSECKKDNTIIINLESTEVLREGEEISNIVKITPNISLDLQYPNYKVIQQLDANKADDTKQVFEVVAKCVNAIIDGDEIHTRDDFTSKEIVSFLDSMSMDMFEKVQEFFSSAPSLVIKHNYDCKECNTNNTLDLKGIGSFFA